MAGSSGVAGTNCSCGAVHPSRTGARLAGMWGEGSTFVAVGEGGALIRSTDGGMTWTNAESDATQWLTGIGGHGSMVMAVGMSETTLRSTDEGATVVAAGHGNELWMVGEEGTVVHSTPIGATSPRAPVTMDGRVMSRRAR